MIKKLSVIVLALGCVANLGAAGRDGTAGERDSLARFDGGIGVLPVSNVVVNATTGAITVNRNIVRGVSPAGQIWVIDELKADVSIDGHIRVKGRGLLLGGGNGIGTDAGQSVFATLICEAALLHQLKPRRPVFHSTPMATSGSTTHSPRRHPNAQVRSC